MIASYRKLLLSREHSTNFPLEFILLFIQNFERSIQRKCNCFYVYFLFAVKISIFCNLTTSFFLSFVYFKWIKYVIHNFFFLNASIKSGEKNFFSLTINQKLYKSSICIVIHVYKKYKYSRMISSIGHLMKAFSVISIR